MQHPLQAMVVWTVRVVMAATVHLRAQEARAGARQHRLRWGEPPSRAVLSATMLRVVLLKKLHMRLAMHLQLVVTAVRVGAARTGDRPPVHRKPAAPALRGSLAVSEA